MINYTDVVDVVKNDIEYKRTDYSIEHGVDESNRMWVEVTHVRIDADTGQWGVGRGGKRYIDYTFTKSDVVRTVFGALVAYEEHEVREFFRFRGVRVFGPHIDYYAKNTDVLRHSDGTPVDTSKPGIGYLRLE